MKWPDVPTILALTVGLGIGLFGLVGLVAIAQGRGIGDNLPLMVGELLAMIIGGLIGAAALSGKSDRDTPPDRLDSPPPPPHDDLHTE